MALSAQWNALLNLVAMHVHGVLLDHIQNFFHILSQIDEPYISDEFYPLTIKSGQFTLPAPYAEICSAATIANIRALSTLTMTRLILSLEDNFWTYALHWSLIHIITVLNMSTITLFCFICLNLFTHCWNDQLQVFMHRFSTCGKRSL